MHTSRFLRNVYFTEGAVERLKLLAQKYGQKNLVISVTGGGCSGFQYHFDLVDNPNALRYVLSCIAYIVSGVYTTATGASKFSVTRLPWN